ncbi:hypothetical protein [Rhodoferax sp.]|uniref:hypothetical protein n=1 Tax=Rhodoferax sp. TaxID=50421 RepID=UPI0027301E97|nr:hypothetical protein [Rhodoferax sp.]MDP2440050.1 hypothetical protein [Rhodoferax sp.]
MTFGLLFDGCAATTFGPAFGFAGTALGLHLLGFMSFACSTLRHRCSTLGFAGSAFGHARFGATLRASATSRKSTTRKGCGSDDGGGDSFGYFGREMVHKKSLRGETGDILEKTQKVK